MPAKVGFFCKSFKPDFDHLANLLDSFQRHNVENLPLMLSIPRDDRGAFRDRFGSSVPNLTLISDEDYCRFDLSILPGWYAQQVCKLMSWVIADCEHYAVLDSDCYFIRTVSSQFLTPRASKKYICCGSLIKTVFREDNNDLLLNYISGSFDPSQEYFPISKQPSFQGFNEIREILKNPMKDLDLMERSAVIFRAFGADKWFYFQPCQIFSRNLLVYFDNFLTAQKLNQSLIISSAPWEYNWYGEFAACFHSYDTDFRVSPFFHVPNLQCVEIARSCGITEDILASKFYWVAMAARHLELLRLDT